MVGRGGGWGGAYTNFHRTMQERAKKECTGVHVKKRRLTARLTLHPLLCAKLATRRRSKATAKHMGVSPPYVAWASICVSGCLLRFQLNGEKESRGRENVQKTASSAETARRRPRPRVRRSKPPPGSVGREKEKPRPWVRQGRPPAQSGERKKSPGLGCGKAAPRHRRAKFGRKRVSESEKQESRLWQAERSWLKKGPAALLAHLRQAAENGPGVLPLQSHAERLEELLAN